ncbi:MAG TPA: LysR family transcriptional regulator [Burkholderiaceae bacterium]|nr:LysR family transcriptional regulator [Burkholderiaceae bacterium]
MNLRHLQALKAVIEEHTTTQAAEKLGLTQPTISNLIASLESTLDIELFKREKGRLLPTPEARKLAVDAEHILAQVHQFTERARHLGELKGGELRMVSLPGPALEFLPRLIADFLADKPEVKCYFQIRPSIEVQDWVSSGHVDLGIAELPIDDHKFDYELLTARCVCIVPEKHPLADRKVITPEDLDNEPFIALEPHHPTYSQLATAFDNAGTTFNVRVNVQLFFPACVLVASGVGVSVVDPVSAQLNANRPIRIIPFEPAIPFTIAIARPANRPVSLLTQSFIDRIKKAYQPYLLE